MRKLSAVAFGAVVATMLSGCGGGSVVELRGIPEVVWDGGGATVTLDVNLSSRGTVFVAFTDRRWDESGEYQFTARELQGIEELDAGRHQFTIDVPAGVSAFFDAKLDAPQTGASIAWTIAVNGKPMWDETITLNGKPSRYEAFAAQVRFDDLASGQLTQVGLWE